MLDASDPIVRTAVFGKQVEQFLESDIGVYLTQRAEAQSDEAMGKLKEVDPNDWQQVMVLQMKIHVAEYILDWLGEAIRAGLQATEHLKEDL
jgi:hypothetical protein